MEALKVIPSTTRLVELQGNGLSLSILVLCQQHPRPSLELYPIIYEAPAMHEAAVLAVLAHQLLFL